MPAAPSALTPYTAFDGHTHVASGSLAEVGLALKRALAADGRPLIFDNTTGKVVDLHLHVPDEALLQMAAALSPAPDSTETPAPAAAEGRGRGRPRLGVVAREVTLLPRHWEWLAGEPGGASVALRKLVEAARRSPEALQRRARERAYQFMVTMAGDEPGFEDTARALFAGDLAQVRERTAHWPPDVRAHALRLAEGGQTAPE
ncbi:MAG: DUF2239 family protein [Rhizobacter sp.]|nr:DUF2239 family protein [Rhizobacter sp.]